MGYELIAGPVSYFCNFVTHCEKRLFEASTPSGKKPCVYVCMANKINKHVTNTKTAVGTWV